MNHLALFRPILDFLQTPVIWVPLQIKYDWFLYQMDFFFQTLILKVSQSITSHWLNCLLKKKWIIYSVVAGEMHVYFIGKGFFRYSACFSLNINSFIVIRPKFSKNWNWCKVAKSKWYMYFLLDNIYNRA